MLCGRRGLCRWHKVSLGTIAASDWWLKPVSSAGRLSLAARDISWASDDACAGENRPPFGTEPHRPANEAGSGIARSRRRITSRDEMNKYVHDHAITTNVAAAIP